MRPLHVLNQSHIIIRMVGLWVVSVIIWRVVGALNDLWIGDSYDRTYHFALALITTALVCLLIEVARRFDQISWSHLGFSTFQNNMRAFLLGLALWVVPAAIGFLMLFVVGLVDITITTHPTELIVSLIILFITVFLIEALPEELIFRGYLYRYLNLLSPHWATVIFQTLLFTLFGYLVGAIYSLEQLLFLPGFAIILGFMRAMSGNVWTGIGFHVALMTVTQMLSPVYSHAVVSGIETLRFVAFILFPSIAMGVVLSFIYPEHRWGDKTPLD